MKYAEVAGNVTRLLAYGSPKATVAHLKSGSLNQAKEPDEVLLKKKVRFKPLNTPNTLKNSNHEIHEAHKNGESLFDAIEALKSAKATKTNNPRFLIVTDFKQTAGHRPPLPLQTLYLRRRMPRAFV